MVRYLAVGGLTFVCYFLLLGLFFSLLRMPHSVAVAQAYILAVAVHFFSNRSFTFRAGGADVAAQAGRYIALASLNLALQVAVVYLVYEVLGWNFYVGAALGVIVTLITGFLLMKTWVFAHRAS